MKTKFYEHTYIDTVISKITCQENSDYKHIWQRLTSSNKYYYVGLIFKITKKGFYYRDNYGVIVYVTWNKMKECDIDE